MDGRLQRRSPAGCDPAREKMRRRQPGREASTLPGTHRSGARRNRQRRACRSSRLLSSTPQASSRLHRPLDRDRLAASAAKSEGGERQGGKTADASGLRLV